MDNLLNILTDIDPDINHFHPKVNLRYTQLILLQINKTVLICPLK